MKELKEVKLYNTQIIMKACTDAMTNNKMIGIIDYSGAGKSYALNKFINENKGAYIVELGVSTSPKEMYVQILNKMRNEDISRNESISNIKRQIRLELAESSGKNLIIIDEASRYEKGKVSYFHELRNMTESHCGLIISGHRDFDKLIYKWITQGVNGVFEFHSRFSYIVKLERPTLSEIKEIFQINDLLKTSEGRDLFKEMTSDKKQHLDFRMIRIAIMEFLNH